MEDSCALPATSTIRGSRPQWPERGATRCLAFMLPDRHAIQQSVTLSQLHQMSFILSVAPPDPQAIRQSVSAVQSRSPVNLPQVMAMPNSNTKVRQASLIMPPPPPPLQYGFAMSHSQSMPSRGPDICIPSAWAQSQHFQLQSPAPQTSNHAVSASMAAYGAQCSCWAQAARGCQSAETISLEITAVYEDGTMASHTCGNIIGSNKNPHFYGKCFPSISSNCKASKPPAFKSTQFCLFVVVPQQQLEEFEDHREKAKCAMPANLKHYHRQTSSCSGITTPSPPPKKHAAALVDSCSPDRANLKEALKTGGAADLDLTS
ncbi:hypothetical protein PAXRUDRAFT_29142, partial [Paxillus rubicundulus Ve08.2h10]